MESFQSQMERMIDLINSYDGRYIIVSHAFPIRCAICYYLDLNEEESFGIDIRYASMSFIDVKRKKPLSIGSLLITDRIKKYLNLKLHGPAFHGGIYQDSLLSEAVFLLMMCPLDNLPFQPVCRPYHC